MNKERFLSPVQMAHYLRGSERFRSAVQIVLLLSAATAATIVLENLANSVTPQYRTWVYALETFIFMGSPVATFEIGKNKLW